MNELKIQVDGILSEGQWLNRSFNKVHELIGGEASELLKFLREDRDYVISMGRGGMLVSLQVRIDEFLEKEEASLKEIMEQEQEESKEKDGESESDQDLKEARLEPIKNREPKKIEWLEVANNMSHCHIVLSRTARLMGTCRERLEVEQFIADAESLYVRISEKRRLNIR